MCVYGCGPDSCGLHEELSASLKNNIKIRIK